MWQVPNIGNWAQPLAHLQKVPVSEPNPDPADVDLLAYLVFQGTRNVTMLVRRTRNTGTQCSAYKFRKNHTISAMGGYSRLQSSTTKDFLSEVHVPYFHRSIVPMTCLAVGRTTGSWVQHRSMIRHSSSDTGLFELDRGRFGLAPRRTCSTIALSLTISWNGRFPVYIYRAAVKSKEKRHIWVEILTSNNVQPKAYISLAFVLRIPGTSEDSGESSSGAIHRGEPRPVDKKVTSISEMRFISKSAIRTCQLSSIKTLNWDFLFGILWSRMGDKMTYRSEVSVDKGSGVEIFNALSNL